LLMVGLIGHVLPRAYGSLRGFQRTRHLRTLTSCWPYRQEGRRAPILQPRPRRGSGGRLLSLHFAELCLILMSFQFGLWSPADVGLSAEVSGTASLAVGVVVYGLWLLLWLLVPSPLRSDQGALTYIYCRKFAQRSRGDRDNRFFIALINPVAEEFWSRGVLVYYIGSLSGSHLLGVGVGLVVCLTLHLYQGTRLLMAHAMMYGVFIALLYSPVGLMGAVGFHLAGNLYPILYGRRYIARWCAHLRELGPRTTDSVARE